MIARSELPERQSESAWARVVTLAFWVLAVMVLVNMHWLHFWGMPLVRPVGYAVILVCCMILTGFNARLWKMLGTPGAWTAAGVASYLLIGVAGAGWQEDMGRDILRQVFFFGVLLASALGGRAIIERTGVEALLKGVFAILTASCCVVLVTPLLREVGVLPFYRIALRLTGGFTDPNDAGFVGCMTVTLAMAFFCRDDNGEPRKLTGLGMFAGYAAVMGSQSRTAALTLLAVLLYFILTNGFVRRHTWFRWLFVPVAVFLAVQAVPILSTFRSAAPASPESSETVMQMRGDKPDVAESSETVMQMRGDKPDVAELSETVMQMRGDKPDVDVDRLSLWRMGFDMFLTSPIVGNGVGSLIFMDGAPLNVEGRPMGVHNLYLLLLGEAGVIPFAAYCLFLVSLARFHWSASTLTRDAVVGWVIVMALFSVSFHHLLTMGAFVFHAGLSCALQRSCKEPAELR